MQNGVNALSKWFKKGEKCQKAQNFLKLGPYDFDQIPLAFGPNIC